MRKYNTPHRRRVIKTRLTEEEYAEFSGRVTICTNISETLINKGLSAFPFTQNILKTTQMNG